MVVNNRYNSGPEEKKYYYSKIDEQVYNFSINKFKNKHLLYEYKNTDEFVDTVIKQLNDMHASASIRATLLNDMIKEENNMIEIVNKLKNDVKKMI